MMSGCVLHVSGEHFDVDAFLSRTSLRPYRVHHRGEARRRSGVFPDSGLSLDVSKADGQLSAKVSDVIRFLTEHETELRRLQSFPGVADLRLDFGYYAREAAAQFDYLPPELLARAGSLGIELSLYHVSPEPAAADLQRSAARGGEAADNYHELPAERSCARSRSSALSASLSIKRRRGKLSNTPS